ncbi:hypothetical protein G7046_g1759 [Stylonectria norvegica]|nr:hypothetical protein G7046_g1759 [Stylonectria norvegica]
MEYISEERQQFSEARASMWGCKRGAAKSSLSQWHVTEQSYHQRPVSCFGPANTSIEPPLPVSTPKPPLNDALKVAVTLVMQSLWSRAGQAHRCGCRACETAVSGLGRRVTTAAQRRKPTFAEVFTACYSSVFATAAIVDAVRKEDRRQDLDRQLEDARRELAEVQHRRTIETTRITANLEADHPDMTLEQMDELWRSLKSIYTNRPFMKEIHRPATLRASEFMTKLKDDLYHCPDESTMQALRQTNYERLERAIMAEESDERIVRRDPQNQKQLHNDSRTVVHLVGQLLDRADIHDSSTSPSPSFDEARQMAAKRSGRFTFATMDPARVKQNMASLNQRLREVVDSPNLGLKEKVGRVCYNLLVSAYPPRHAHLQYFDRRLRKIGPPEPSRVFDSNNHGRFLRALACITGLDTETGAKLGRRHVDDVDTQQASRHWTRGGKTTTRTGDWIWEHVPINQSLTEAIINGLLHFKLFDQAATFFLSCLKANVSLSTSITTQLFEECIVALDWRAAVRLIREFTTYQDRWSTMLLDHDENLASYFTDRFNVLLDICGLRTPGQTASVSTLANLDISSSKFNQFMDQLSQVNAASQLGATSLAGSTWNPEVNAALKASTSRLLQIESLWKEQALVRSTTLSIESKLLYPEFSPQFRASMALQIGEAATKVTLQLNEEFVETLTANSQLYRLQNTLEECERFRKALQLGSPSELDVQDEPVVPPTDEQLFPATREAAEESQSLMGFKEPAATVSWTQGSVPQRAGFLWVPPGFVPHMNPSHLQFIAPTIITSAKSAVKFRRQSFILLSTSPEELTQMASESSSLPPLVETTGYS